MKYVPVVLAGALALAVAAAPVRAADETKTAKGTVTAVAGDTVTLKVMDKNMVFKVDKDTDVIARGGTTATKQAQKLGMEGAKLSDVVKVGDGVEIHYKDVGGVMTATQIRGGVSVGAGSVEEPKPAGKVATGKVIAVAGNSITVNSAGKDWTFPVDAKTRIEGVGASTKMRELEKLGKTPVLTEFVGVGDEVSVDYQEMAGAMHVSEIRVIKRVK
jgi:hypothetical protein